MRTAPYVEGDKRLKTKKYYLEKAAYMRDLARNAQTEKLRASCLKAAEDYEAWAKLADEAKSHEDAE